MTTSAAPETTMAPTTTPVVSSLGSTRRLRALQFAGHNQREIGAALGVHWHIVRDLTARTRPGTETVAEHIADRITALTKQWGNHQITNNHVHARARQEGWRPLFWWDNIDDPNESDVDDTDDVYVPDEREIQFACEGTVKLQKLRLRDQREVVRRMAATNMEGHRIAKRIGVTVRTIQRVRAEMRAAQIERQQQILVVAYIWAYVGLWQAHARHTQAQVLTLHPAPDAAAAQEQVAA